jgi:hypothetical protein
VIHAVILNLQGVNWLMLLNGLGYFVLTLVIFVNPKILAVHIKLLHYLFMLFTLITIVGFFLLNDSYGPLGIIAKVDEIVLLVALWLHSNK